MIETASAGLKESLLLLDTHVCVWLREGNSRLKRAVLNLVEHHFQQDALCVSSISAWELGMLVAKGKLDFGQTPSEWFNEFVRKFRVNVIELTPEIAIKSSFLPGNFHGDPADRMILATAIAVDSAVLSADRNMVSYGKKGFVRVIAI